MDAFTKTLHSVLAGTRSLEEFGRVLVTSAVEDALLCVSRDYGYDYGVLLKKCRRMVVDRHTSGSLAERILSAGKTKGGTACGRRAVLHGCCQQHAVEAAQRQGRLREREAIADAVENPRAAEAADLIVVCGGSVPSPAVAFAV